MRKILFFLIYDTTFHFRVWFTVGSNVSYFKASKITRSFQIKQQRWVLTFLCLFHLVLWVRLVCGRAATFTKIGKRLHEFK